MRLIDADAIHYCNYDLDNYHSFRAVDEDEITEMPTIDPEDLRPKGKWIRPTKINGRSFDLPHCSVCEGIPCGVDENTRYCSHCGAKMENKPCE